MAPPLYTFTIPVFINGLKSLTAILKKAEAYAQEKGIPLDDLVNSRLYEDMRPLPFQVFLATSVACKTASRLTLSEPGDFQDTDKTFEDFYARIEKAIAELEALDPAAIAGKEDTKFKAPMGPVELDFTPHSYATSWGLPNFFFHLDTAYGILRAKGVPLGKRDYLTGFLTL